MQHREVMDRRFLVLPATCVGLALAGACAARATAPSNARVGVPFEAGQVEVIRTSSGVPHIYADNFRALGYALGYLQLEDYGDRVPMILLGARGELARHQGPGALEADFASRPYYQRAVETYPRIDRDTRDVYEGFVAGVNRYIALHPDEFPPWMSPEFTGHDVAAAYVYRTSQATLRRWMRRLTDVAPAPSADPEDPDRFDAGSSAWALAPGRTTSGAAILLRNPHLSWNAGYWEAHVVVRGRLDFYGDFRIGGPIGIVGGFNQHLGFATTNNDVNTEEVYALDLDPRREDHYLFDGASMPIGREPINVSYLDGASQALASRERLTTHVGPVLHRGNGKVYVLRDAEDGAYRGGDQFLRMMQARNLAEWKDAMRLRAHPGSNFVYADADGNIFYLWNAAIPRRPHAAGNGNPVPAARTDQIWADLHGLDELPQLINPRGGYVRNENDPPWLTNLRQPLAAADFPPYFESDGPLSLRSQHSVLLIDSDARVSLEDVVRLKHSDRMLLADRVKDDLLAAVRAALPGRTFEAGDRAMIAAAVDLLHRWNNTAAAASRGAVLFAEWWRLYTDAVEGEPFAEPWRADAPLSTPKGLFDADNAVGRFAEAVRQTTARFGSLDVAWGDVYRIRRGNVDEPASGCPGALGCFRVLNYSDADDGRRVASGGDGWVLAVEFTSPPRAYSILAYGQSLKTDSPYHDDQAALFARGAMKPVAYTRADVERAAVRRYRPGSETGLGRSQSSVASWLDEGAPAGWNKPGLPIPAAPAIEGVVDPRCRENARPPELDADRRVRDRGWDLVGAYLGGWEILVIRGAAGYDGMCRPRQYQDFVFVRGVFAGTLSPRAMESRTDGAIGRVSLQSRNRLTAEFARYAAVDPLCCPSRATSVEFEIAGDPMVLRPVSASTSGQ
jgi:acyl-homoserine-lactone acylase